MTCGTGLWVTRVVGGSILSDRQLNWEGGGKARDWEAALLQYYIWRNDDICCTMSEQVPNR